MPHNDNLSASLEDYLEAIYRAAEADGTTRTGVLAKRLQVSSASVTGALHALDEHGLVNYRPYKQVTLTPAGEAAAARIARRHRVLRDFLADVLLLDAETADTTACRIEHAISEDVLERMVCLADLIAACPRLRGTRQACLRAMCNGSFTTTDCAACLADGAAGLEPNEPAAARPADTK